MSSSIAIAHEPLVRLGMFILVFLTMALWEVSWPRRQRAFSRRVRWPQNIGLLVVDISVQRIVAPGAAIAVALAGEVHGWGLLPSLAIPVWVAIPLAAALLDLAIYFQHVAFHAVPALWRLHRVHHTDLDFDVTTGTRFHPIEIVISTGVKCAAVAAIGAPAIAVLAFEVLLNGTAVFNHANVRLPLALDSLLRWIVVTPDMHRVHHSVVYNETNSNFGFNLPWWDRLFGTYRAQPAAGHEAMTIGVDAFRTREDLRLDRMLVQPFRESPGGYAINCRPEAQIDVRDGREARHA
jgi:sterol desaturase/sphingolipid hydroxylase (fatty acid hydroxylase superfamily)